eukprot:190368_1
MAAYLKSPTKETSYPRTPTTSPIASKAKTQREGTRSHVKNLLKRFESSDKEEIVSVHDNPLNKSLFSPKYIDTTLHCEDENILNSPEASPLKKRQTLDRECEDSVLSIKRSLWSSAAEELDGFLFMKYAPALPPNYFANKKPVLPPQVTHRGKYTLVLDLDETLVHCSVNKVETCDLIFPVIFGGDKYNVYMRKRPYFKQFLETVSQIFEVVVFTASQQCYADKLLNLVDPHGKLIHYRLFRQHCINVEGNFVKDLRVLGRDLKKTMIIDNSPPAFTYQVNNGIPIVSWYDDEYDDELLKMIPLLKKLATLSDVSSAIKKYFQLKKLLKSVRM